MGDVIWGIGFICAGLLLSLASLTNHMGWVGRPSESQKRLARIEAPMTSAALIVIGVFVLL